MESDVRQDQRIRSLAPRLAPRRVPYCHVCRCSRFRIPASRPNFLRKIESGARWGACSLVHARLFFSTTRRPPLDFSFREATRSRLAAGFAAAGDGLLDGLHFRVLEPEQLGHAASEMSLDFREAPVRIDDAPDGLDELQPVLAREALREQAGEVIQVDALAPLLLRETEDVGDSSSPTPISTRMCRAIRSRSSGRNSSSACATSRSRAHADTTTGSLRRSLETGAERPEKKARSASMGMPSSVTNRAAEEAGPRPTQYATGPPPDSRCGAVCRLSRTVASAAGRKLFPWTSVRLGRRH